MEQLDLFSSEPSQILPGKTNTVKSYEMLCKEYAMALCKMTAKRSAAKNFVPIPSEVQRLIKEIKSKPDAIPQAGEPI